MIEPGMRSVAALASREPDSPWSADPTFSPALVAPPTPAPPGVPSPRGVVSTTAWLAFGLYQQTWSKLDGPTCGFAPTCSRYALEAVTSLGPMGVALGFGRLMRLEGDIGFHHVHRSGRLEDPLSNHTFFWRAPALDAFHTFEDRAHAWHGHVRAMRAWRTP